MNLKPPEAVLADEYYAPVKLGKQSTILLKAGHSMIIIQLWYWKQNEKSAIVESWPMMLMSPCDKHPGKAHFIW